MRQSAAITLFAYSIKYIDNRNLKKYILLLLFGFLFFHYTLIILLSLYYLSRLRLSNKIKVTLLIIEIISYKMILYIIKLSPYGIYLDLKFHNATSFTFLFYILLTLIAYYIYNENIIIKNIIFISIMLQILMIFVKEINPEMIYRINYYFFITIIIAIPNGLKKIKFKKGSKTIIFGMVYLLLILIFLRTSVINGKKYKLIPYKANFNIFYKKYN